MKPIKNRHFCPECLERKMCFETEKAAYSFIEYESGIILEENGYCPIRAYECRTCGCWHLTSEYLYEDDCCECCVDREEMAKARRLLGLVIRNTHTIALNLSRKINILSRLLNDKVVDWDAVNLIAQELIEIFEKVGATPYRYMDNVRKQWTKFHDLCHLYTWRKNLISVA